MMAKITTNSNFGTIVNYIMNETKGAKIIDSQGVMATSSEAMIYTFEAQRDMRPEIKEPVLHISLDFSAEDREKIIDDLMREVAREYMQRMGLTNTQYFAARHFDKEHPHIHLCINRIDNDGKLISLNHSKNRSVKVCRDLTNKHNLYISQGKDNVNRHRLRGADKTRYEIYDTIKDVLPSCSSWQELTAKLRGKGIDIEFKYNGSTNEIQGVKFVKENQRFSGSKVDRAFSYSKIDSVLKSNNQSIKINHSPKVKPRETTTQRGLPNILTPQFGGYVASDKNNNYYNRKKKRGQSQ